MTKIVINNYYGRFALSPAAVLRYAELKGIKLYEGRTSYGDAEFTTVPAEELADQVDFYSLSMNERAASNAKYKEQHFSYDSIARDDALLVQVVEEMGTKASNRHASLKVVEIPDDVQWDIRTLDDGLEYVEEQHRTWS